MKNFIFVATLCLAVTFAMGMKYPQTYDKLQRIASHTKFGQTILETIQVELETSADPRPRILELINNLLKETQDAQENDDKEHKTNMDACEKEQASLNARITDLGNQITADQGYLATNQTKKGQKEEEHQGYVDEIERLKGLIEQLDTNRAKEAAAYKKRDEKFAKILEVLEKVRQYIQNRVDTRDATFLQKKETGDLYNSLSQIKETVTSSTFAILSPGYSRMINFIATKAQQALTLTPEEADTNARNGLKSIVALIDSLISEFETKKAENTQNEKDAIELYKSQRQDHVSDQRAAETARDLVQGEINALIATIKSLEGRIKTNTGLKKDAEDDLEKSIAECNALQVAYDERTKQRTEELGLLREVKKIVEEELSGLGNTTETAIKNSNINTNV